MCKADVTNDDIRKLYQLACEVGHTFRCLRIAEETDDEEKARLALKSPYDKLAEWIEELHERLPFKPEDRMTGQDWQAALKRWNNGERTPAK